MENLQNEQIETFSRNQYGCITQSKTRKSSHSTSILSRKEQTLKSDKYHKAQGTNTKFLKVQAT